ncbi:MAG: hypothetical protein M1813_009705 [Trichoglossum hirsutum]|nr:MAG: hypothetical protein M1813_009705 [Trichoglossum hirsutum]
MASRPMCSSCSRLVSLGENATLGECKDAQQIVERLLSSIHDLLADKRLAIGVSYTVRRKSSVNETDKRISRIYSKPPVDSVQAGFIAENSKKWQEDPSAFWGPGIWQPAAETQNPTLENPECRVVYRCLQVDGDGIYYGILSRLSWVVLSRVLKDTNDKSRIAKMLHESGLHFGLSIEGLISSIEKFFDKGSRYENLAERLGGVGVLIVLRHDIASSVWEKWLPKSGDSFEKAIEHLRGRGIEMEAAPYQALAKKLVTYRVNQMFGNRGRTKRPHPGSTSGSKRRHLSLMSSPSSHHSADVGEEASLTASENNFNRTASQYVIDLPTRGLMQETDNQESIARWFALPDFESFAFPHFDTLEPGTSNTGLNIEGV